MEEESVVLEYVTETIGCGALTEKYFPFPPYNNSSSILYGSTS